MPASAITANSSTIAPTAIVVENVPNNSNNHDINTLPRLPTSVSQTDDPIDIHANDKIPTESMTTEELLTQVALKCSQISNQNSTYTHRYDNEGRSFLSHPQSIIEDSTVPSQFSAPNKIFTKKQTLLLGAAMLVSGVGFLACKYGLSHPINNTHFRYDNSTTDLQNLTDVLYK